MTTWNTEAVRKRLADESREGPPYDNELCANCGEPFDWHNDEDCPEFIPSEHPELEEPETCRCVAGNHTCGAP